MTLGAHLTPRARSEIERADVVFIAVSDALVEAWVGGMHRDVRSLQPYYAEGKSRRATYAEMVDVMLAEVRAGRRVCGVFYGHPGIFALAPHRAVEQARREGFDARMEPGISSEDCLYADLGIDPGTVGCQHYEATQFLVNRRRVDESAWLVLWQVGHVGDLTLGQRTTGSAYRRILRDVLLQWYPPTHIVVVYRSAVLPIERPSIRHMALADLPDAAIGTTETLAIPPSRALEPAEDVRAALHALVQAETGRPVAL